MRTRLRHVAYLLVAVAAIGDAQVAHPGISVRVRAPGVLFERFTGVYLGRAGGDTLLFGNDERGPVRVPASAITTLDIGRGTSRWRGALVGAAWGAGVGAVLALVATTDTSDISREEAAGFLVLGGAELGAIIGAVTGRRVWVTAQPSVLTTAAFERRRAIRLALRAR